MMAAVKLAWPLLRSATAWWYFWPFMLLWAWAGWQSTDELGIGTSAGGCALLLLGGALGSNLRRCSTRTLVRVLPGFLSQSLLATGAVLVSLAILFAALDGWGSGSLLALLTAAALGLGAGLSVPPLWIVSLAVWVVIIWQQAVGLGLATIWTGIWSPWIAALWLALGLILFWRHGLSGRSHASDDSNPRPTAADPRPRGRQPYRLGRLLNPWPWAVGYMAMGVLVGLWFGLAEISGEPSTALTAEQLPALTQFLVLFAGVGVFAMLMLLLGQTRQSLRQLAVLPGWSRGRLFLHAELSAWRACLAQVLVLALVLLLAGLWAGQFEIRLLTTAFAFIGSLGMAGIYLALWIAREPHMVTRSVVMMFVFLPVLLIAPFFFRESSGAQTAITTVATGFIIGFFALLAWWLRGRARAAWNSISFRRET